MDRIKGRLMSFSFCTLFLLFCVDSVVPDIERPDTNSHRLRSLYGRPVPAPSADHTVPSRSRHHQHMGHFDRRFHPVRRIQKIVRNPGEWLVA